MSLVDDASSLPSLILTRVVLFLRSDQREVRALVCQSDTVPDHRGAPLRCAQLLLFHSGDWGHFSTGRTSGVILNKSVTYIGLYPKQKNGHIMARGR